LSRLWSWLTTDFSGGGGSFGGGGATGVECGCLEAGTLVATPEGLQPIERIAIGQLVLAVNEVTGDVAPKRVTDLIRPDPKPLYALHVLDSGGEAERFHATDDHPWKVEGKGWTQTIDLKPGDRVDTSSGADLVVTSLELTKRTEKTYNLTVADWHTFMIGEDMAVVHNACPPSGVPSSWLSIPPTKNDRLNFVNPANKHQFVRVKQDGTIVQMHDGRAVDRNGNLVDPRSPAAHNITSSEFIFRRF
jgi:hypothetical protein